MIQVDLSKATDWARVINTLPSLVGLSLTGCGLDFTTPLNSVNVTTSRLANLSLSNYLSRSSGPSSVVPNWVFQISTLAYLDLSSNNFVGSIPNVINTTKLQHVDFSSNFFNSSIPVWLYTCKELEHANFVSNMLEGQISSDIKNLTSLRILGFSSNKLSGKLLEEFGSMSQLKVLALWDNYLQGEIPSSIGNLTKMTNFNVYMNQLHGAIPSALGKLSSLKLLSLEGNSLTGNIPESLGQLSKLKYFQISNNMLEGVVTERIFVNFTKLLILSASGNNLTLKVPPDWVPPFNLEYLKLGSWNVGTSIPSWIQQTQKSLVCLDLSNTGISGTFPNWLWNVSLLFLSHNKLHGHLPSIIPNVSNPLALSPLIYLGNNQFSGPLPKVRTDVEHLDLSNNLFSGDISNFFCDKVNGAGGAYAMSILDLSNNELSGVVPDCWENWKPLNVLHLGNNSISGSIPNSVGFLSELKSLNLRRNGISGTIPFSILNCPNLLMVDLSHNNLEGIIPIWIGRGLARLGILILKSNQFSGPLPSDICHLQFLRILDVSNNSFSGSIPSCVGNFIALRDDWYKVNGTFALPVYRPGFAESAYITTKGIEILYRDTLRQVTSIDLSMNNFSGQIPMELTYAVKLRFLNLSMNQLAGSIPKNIGDMEELESLDLSRNHLSGGIPDSFKALSSLSYLNLSYNNLSGRIPECTQFESQDPSSFAGNNLCGLPLTKNCSTGRVQVPSFARKATNKSEVQWLYVLVSLGYATGVSAVCAVLVVKKPLRDAYFEFVEEMWDEIYLYFYIKWARLVRRFRSSL